MSSERPLHSTMPSNWRIGLVWPIGPRVEDPVRLKELSEALSALTWDDRATRASLQVVFQEISRITHAELRYYYTRRKVSGRRAGFFRLVAWLVGTVGVLTPIVHPLISNPPANFLSWGYLAIALAGALVVADSVFAGTEAQGRFVSTQLRIEHIYSKFALEWQALLVAYDHRPTPETAADLMERAIRFVDSLHESLGDETAEWKVTMQKIREELSRQAGSKPE